MTAHSGEIYISCFAYELSGLKLQLPYPRLNKLLTPGVSL